MLKIVRVKSAPILKTVCSMSDITFLEKCEKQESNLRTPARIDLESIPVDHLGILAWNNICFRIVKGFEFGLMCSFTKLGHKILSPPLLTT